MSTPKAVSAADAAKCTCAIGLLEAAAQLISRAGIEGPSGNGLGGQIADINRQIHNLQGQFLEIHDRHQP